MVYGNYEDARYRLYQCSRAALTENRSSTNIPSDRFPQNQALNKILDKNHLAWKTGTTWGFRAAWSAGSVGPYVLVVWIGDFSGHENPSFVGVDATAPLFFRIADALDLARAKERFPI